MVSIIAGDCQKPNNASWRIHWHRLIVSIFASEPRNTRSVRRLILRLTILYALLALFITGAAHAADQELDRVKAEFANADRELNEQYQLTRKALSESQFDALREEQRDWLRYRDARSNAAVHYEERSTPEGQEQSSVYFWQKMTDLTRQRTEMVKAWRDMRFDKPLTGRYADDYGGSMLLYQDDDKLYFLIEVVRGPTYHLGGITGIAQINGHMARYSDNDTENKKKETWVTFITGGQRLKLITANAHYYHGARAYFDGEYLRVADLTPQEKKAVIEGEIEP